MELVKGVGWWCGVGVTRNLKKGQEQDAVKRFQWSEAESMISPLNKQSVLGD